MCFKFCVTVVRGFMFVFQLVVVFPEKGKKHGLLANSCFREDIFPFTKKVEECTCELWLVFSPK